MGCRISCLLRPTPTGRWAEDGGAYQKAKTDPVCLTPDYMLWVGAPPSHDRCLTWGGAGPGHQVALCRSLEDAGLKARYKVRATSSLAAFKPGLACLCTSLLSPSPITLPPSTPQDQTVFSDALFSAAVGRPVYR